MKLESPNATDTIPISTKIVIIVRSFSERDYASISMTIKPISIRNIVAKHR
jgi:hypothetical protein